MIYYRICLEDSPVPMAISVDLNNADAIDDVRAVMLGAEKFEKGNELDAQLWLPVLIPRFGSGAVVLINKFNNMAARAWTNPYASGGFGFITQVPLSEIDASSAWILPDGERSSLRPVNDSNLCAVGGDLVGSSKIASVKGVIKVRAVKNVSFGEKWYFERFE